MSLILDAFTEKCRAAFAGRDVQIDAAQGPYGMIDLRVLIDDRVAAATTDTVKIWDADRVIARLQANLDRQEATP